MGAKISKRYSSYKLQPKVFKLVLNFLPDGPHKTMFGIWTVKWLRSFCGHSVLFRLSAIHSTLYLVNSCRRVKLSELWAAGVSMQCMQGILTEPFPVWQVTKQSTKTRTPLVSFAMYP